MKLMLSLLLFFSVHLSGYCQEISRVVAKVNNNTITSRDLEDYCTMIVYQLPEERDLMAKEPTKFRKQALSRLIDDQLILDMAKKEKDEEIKKEKDEEKKKKLEVPSGWVSNKIDNIISSFPSRVEFEKSLVEKGISMAILRERIKEQYLVQEAIAKHVRYYIDVSPQEMLDYYKNHQSNFLLPLRYEFYVAKSDNKNLLTEIESSLKNNDPQDVIAKYSNELIKMESTETELKDDILKIIKSLKPGQASINQIDSRYNLIFLSKILEASVASFADQRDKIFNFLWEQKYRLRLEEWIRELRNNSVIKILEPNYK